LYKNALVEIEDTVAGTRRYDLIAADVVGNAVTLVKPVTETLWEGQRIRLIEAHVQVRYQPSEGPAMVEDIRNVRLKEETAGDPPHIWRRVPGQSQLIDVRTPPVIDIGALEDFPQAVDGDNKPVTWMSLEDGDDDLGGLDVDAFVGTDGGPGKRTGIQ